ncbi:MAG: hypothetical protein KGL39_35515 [Patescibacteria group bacterium]|nr:hypothetical protein [Patescibacteria group bacterium]
MEHVLEGASHLGVAVLLSAGLLWLIWYRERVTIPNMTRAFARELRRERRSCERRHRELVGELRDLTRAVAGQGGAQAASPSRPEAAGAPHAAAS